MICIPELRALGGEVLSDRYLSEAEATDKRREIPDPYLLPAGKSKQGKLPVERAVWQPVGPTAIRKMFVAVEEMASVEHVERSGLYGLRRQAIDSPEFA